MNTSNKTLLQLLVEELPKHGGWPEGVKWLAQTPGGSILGREIYQSGPHFSLVLDTVADDYCTAKVMRDQYEAALAAQAPVANADGWIEWAGGECQVDHMQAVEVRYRDGTIKPVAPAFHYLWTNSYGDCKTTDADIVAYRLHQPQEANSRANDDRLAGDLVSVGLVEKPIDDACRVEADLNDCIGQTPEDLEQLTRLMVEEINYSYTDITLANAYKIASNLIDAGYRKQ